jgi:hypothetical protein
MRLHEVVEDTCKRNGIQYDLCPEHKRNGAAAHATAAYLQKAKSMLHTARMDAPYWGAGARHSCTPLIIYTQHKPQNAPKAGIMQR